MYAKYIWLPGIIHQFIQVTLRSDKKGFYNKMEPQKTSFLLLTPTLSTQAEREIRGVF
jgi:hypothetical protein